MRGPSSGRIGHQRQEGVTLVVGLILLVLITLVVINAFMLTSSNLKTVLNTQVRAEAIAAGNEALEKVISSNFYVTPAAETITVDLNNDGTEDSSVSIAVPVCTKATVASTGSPSDVELGTSLSSGGTWFTDWDLRATITDAATGGSVIVSQGARVMISDAQKILSCP